MKKLFAILISVCFLLSATGCSKDVPVSTTMSVPPTTTAPQETHATETTLPIVYYEAPLVAVSMPMVAWHETAADGTVLFSGVYQTMELTVQDPQVADAVVLEYINRVDAAVASAQTVADSASVDYSGQSNWVPYSCSITYNPVRLDDTILSLYGTQHIFDGSPRSASASISVTYDLLTGSALELKEVLIPNFSADRLAALITEALSDYAAQGSLYSDYAYVIEELFSTNRPIDNWFLSGAGLCFYFAPYEIAPYSAGTVIAQVPYEKLSGMLKEAYFPAEQVSFSGSHVLSDMQETEVEKFSQFTELILTSGTSQYLLYSDGTLTNLRIDCGTWNNDGSFSQEMTVFAAATLCITDAVMIQADQQTLQSLRLTYEADGVSVSVPLA